MKVKQLIAELREYPQDAEVYVTDDGSAWIEDWSSGISEVSAYNTAGEGSGVLLTFEGFFLRNAIEQDL